MEMALNSGFSEMSQDEKMSIDGGIGLLAAVLICGGCFVVGGLITYGICCLVD